MVQNIGKTNEKTQAKTRQDCSKKTVSQAERNGKIVLTSNKFTSLSTTSSTASIVNDVQDNGAAKPKFDNIPDEQTVNDESELQTELKIGEINIMFTQNIFFFQIPRVLMITSQ